LPGFAENPLDRQTAAMTRLRLLAAASAIAMLVGGCAATGPSVPDASSSAPQATPSRSVAPSPSSATSVSPVPITYTAFTQAGGTPIRSETLFGPGATLLAYACVPEVSGELWTFTATSTTPGALACVLGFGGRIVARDAAYDEGLVAPETVDCTRNPGR
jgi:hypothetical protein